MNDFKFGALLPPGMEWQKDKTAASIAFVNESERYLLNHPEAENKLRSKIDLIKAGAIILTNWKTVEEALLE